MLTSKGRALCIYLMNNATKDQLEIITAFMNLVTGVRFDNFEQAMNFTSLEDYASVFVSSAEAAGTSENDVEAGVIYTLKVNPDVDEAARLLCRDILRDGQNFFQTIKDVRLTSADYTITRRAL